MSASRRLVLAAAVASMTVSSPSAMPLAFTVPANANPESTIGHKVNLQMKRKTVKVVVTIYDRNGDKTFANTIDVK